MAQLRGVEVLNINELANALKPVVLPGEFMKVFILKEGKEYNQGVAYLDDGTMVVVDNARRMISRNIDVVVTSVLQTTAGKMIFGRYIEGAAPALIRRRRRKPPAKPRRRASNVGDADYPKGRRSVSLTARGAPPPLALARRLRASLGPQALSLVKVPPYHWWRTVFFLIPADLPLHHRPRHGVARLDALRSQW